ncbi:hypothetical protein DPEC_G00042390, partial [Dallia pectoralis]
ALISLLPILVNNSVNIYLAAGSDPSPLIITTEAISTTIASIRKKLEHLNLSSGELIGNELHVLDNLIKLAAAGNSSVYSLNATDPLMKDPVNAQKVYLEMAQWYLVKLENVTSYSTFSELLDPLVDMAAMGLSLQLPQAELTILVREEVEYLLRTIQYPINGTDVSRIGQSITRILKKILELLHLNIAHQANTGNQNQTLINELEAMISNGLPVLEELIELVTSGQSPVYSINSTDPLMQDPINAEKVYLETVHWYLRKLHNVTSNSTFSKLLDPFFQMAEMQLDLQLFQTEVSIFVRKEIENFIESVPYPINDTNMMEISQSFIGLLNDNLDVLKLNFVYQDILQNVFGQLNWLNNSFLSELENQVRSYLNVTEDWLKDPNVTQVIINMWNISDGVRNMTNPGMDLQQLLQTLGYLLSPEQQTYLTDMQQISQALNQGSAGGQLRGRSG